MPTDTFSRSEVLARLNLADDAERAAARALNTSELAAAYRFNLRPSEYLKARNELKAAGEI
jgi:hypothetical protein